MLCSCTFQCQLEGYTSVYSPFFPSFSAVSSADIITNKGALQGCCRNTEESDKLSLHFVLEMLHFSKDVNMYVSID